MPVAEEVSRWGELPGKLGSTSGTFGTCYHALSPVRCGAATETTATSRWSLSTFGNNEDSSVRV